MDSPDEYFKIPPSAYGCKGQTITMAHEVAMIQNTHRELLKIEKLLELKIDRKELVNIKQNG